MRRKKKKRMPWLLLILIPAILAIGVQWLTLRGVRVVGNRTLSSEEIIRQSGVKPGDNLLALSDEKIRRKLSDNYYIQYLGKSFDYNGVLTLHIKERVGMGSVRLLGIRYALDEDGVVLRILESGEEESGPEILGLTLRNGVWPSVGQPLPVQDAGQLERMQRVLRALYEVNLLARVDRVNLEIYDNLIVTTREDTGIILGDDAQLTLKLAIAREVLSIRREDAESLKGAWIDVSSGVEAHFIPKTLPTPTPMPTPTPTLGPSLSPTALS